jgi:hypothetical protein
LGVPHVLIELSKLEMKCHADNSIHVQGISICPDTKNVLYNNIKYGSHIKSKKYSTIHEEKQLFDNIIQIEKIKSRYIMILVDKKECLQHFPTLLVSSSVGNKSPSGKLVIMACILDVKKDSTSHIWQEKDFDNVKRCKPNIMSSFSHHGSLGYYASFWK